MSTATPPRALTASAPPVRLHRNESPYPPGPAVQAVLSQWWSHTHRYPDLADTADLAAALADRHELGASQLVIGAGSADVLRLVAQHRPAGSTILTPELGWEAYPQLLEAYGARLDRLPTSAGPGVTGPMVYPADVAERVLTAVTDTTSAVLLTSPHNPTGQVLDPAALRRIVEGVPEHVLVVVDEAYAEYVPTGANVAQSLDLLRDGAENLLVTRTFSKAWSLAGLRVGWAATTAARARTLRDSQIPFAVPTLAARAAIAALSDEVVTYQQIHSTCAEREWLRHELRAQGYPCPENHGNFLWLPLGDRAADLTGYLHRAGISVTHQPGGIRVSIATRADHDALLAATGTYPS